MMMRPNHNQHQIARICATGISRGGGDRVTSASASRFSGRAIEIPFDPAVFPDPLNIDNEFFPLVVGTTTVFRAEGPDGCEEFRYHGDR